MTPRYPAMFDIVDSTSIDCAREMRGMASSESPVAFLAFNAAKGRAGRPGASGPITVAPSAAGRSRPRSAR